MFDGIFNAISDTIRSLLFGPLGAVLGWIIDIVNIILTDISGFSFIDLDFVTQCYTTCVTIALVILPLKLVYEWIWLVISNDVEKWGGKILAVFQITVILLATPPVLTQVGNAVAQINTAMLAGDVVEGESAANGAKAGEGFAVTMLVATTGLSEEEAIAFMEDFRSEDFDINVKDEEDNYIYDFDFIMPMLIGLAMWVIIFFIGLQMASRQVSLAFFKIITPLCALSLTNKESATAFTVWKNNIIGAFLMNMVQIFLFLFMFRLIAGLGAETAGLTKLLFTIALLLVIIAIPNKVAAMVGGYSAGIMEGLAGMQQTLMMLSSGITAGRALGGTIHAGGNIVKGGAKLLANSPRNLASKAGGAASRAAGMADSIRNSTDKVKDAMKYGGVAGGMAAVGGDMFYSAKDRLKNKIGGVGQEFKRGKREADLNAAFNRKNPLVMKETMSPKASSSMLRGSDRDSVSARQQESKDSTSGRFASNSNSKPEELLSSSAVNKNSSASNKGFERINTTGRLNKQRNNKERRLK